MKIDTSNSAHSPGAGDLLSSRGVPNPSIGEMSLGASLSLGSACHLERGLGGCGVSTGENASVAPDRESASNTAIGGPSRTGSVASNYMALYDGSAMVPDHLVRPGSSVSVTVVNGRRIIVGADVHSGLAAANAAAAATRKKFSLSSERLSETVSCCMSERSATVSLAADNDGAASTRALAGSILGYRMAAADTQSVGSYRLTGYGEDEISLRSLPGSANAAAAATGTTASGGSGLALPPRSLSPTVSSMSGDELSVRRSARRRPHLDKQVGRCAHLTVLAMCISQRCAHISWVEITQVH